MMKTYKIQDVARIMNLPASTIRYYEKEGLLPFIQRLDSGYRIFTEQDIRSLRVIECLKKSGMPLKEIRQFIQWIQEGDSSLEKRYEMFLERKRIVESQIYELQNTLHFIDYKCQYYQAALEAGTEAIHQEKSNSSQLHKENVSAV